MNTDELTAAVTDLEHYLFDIWKYEDLREIGTLFQHLELDSEPGDARQRQLAREGSAELQRLLANSYQCALLEIDEVLPGLGGGPVVDALLEKLRDTVALLARDGAYFQWLERTWQPPIEEDQFAHEDADSDGLILRSPPNDPREHFGYVSRDFAFYVNKVVEHLDRYRQRKEVDTDPTLEPAQNPERIRWIGSAALFGQFFHELAAAGRIIPPQRAGGHNWTAVARTLYAAFDIRKGQGEPVKYSSLEAALKPEGDRDILGGKDAFKIYPVK
jgi:hypothetical protein